MQTAQIPVSASGTVPHKSQSPMFVDGYLLESSTVMAVSSGPIDDAALFLRACLRLRESAILPFCADGFETMVPGACACGMRASHDPQALPGSP